MFCRADGATGLAPGYTRPGAGTPVDPPDDPAGGGTPTGTWATLFASLFDVAQVWFNDQSGTTIANAGSGADGTWTGAPILKQPSLLTDDAAQSSMIRVADRATFPSGIIPAPPWSVFFVYQRLPQGEDWQNLLSWDYLAESGFDQAWGGQIAHKNDGAIRLAMRDADAASVNLETAAALVEVGDVVGVLVSIEAAGIKIYVGSATAAASNAMVVGGAPASPLAVGQWRPGYTPSRLAALVGPLGIRSGAPPTTQNITDLMAGLKARVRWANTVDAGEIDQGATKTADLLASAAFKGLRSTVTMSVTTDPATGLITFDANKDAVIEAGGQAGADEGRYSFTDAFGTAQQPGRVHWIVRESSDPPIDQGNIFLNPFSKLAIHHRPIGAGAQIGIPPGYDVVTKALVTQAVLGSRGRLDAIGTFSAGLQGDRLRKAHLTNDPAIAGSTRTIAHNGSGAGPNLPVAMRLPTDTGLSVYSGATTDNNPGVYDVAGSSSRIPGLYHLFFQYRDDLSNAAGARLYRLDGLDYTGEDSFDRGTSASSIRWPSCVLQDYEINPSSPSAIHHPLNVAVTRREAAASLQVLSRYGTWPAMSRDATAGNANENQGNIPYGALAFVPAADYAALVADFPWSARQTVILDVLRYYGVYLLDGTNRTEPVGGVTKAVMQLRVSLGVPLSIIDEINVALARILPKLQLLANPRNYSSETELYTNGLPYRGGGGPINFNSINTAYDA